MAEITLEMIKSLRERTDAPMADCKKALAETGGDFETAVDWLRKKGAANAAKKTDRVASDGLVAISVNGLVGTVVEVNSETDFVARNEKFQNLVSSVLAEAGKNKGDFAVTSSKVEQIIAEGSGSIGERIVFRRSAQISVSEGIVATYIHNAVEGNLSMGKIAVLLGVKSDCKDKARLQEFAKRICMHIAALSPLSLDRSSFPVSVLEREKAIFTEQSKSSGKPDNILEKMIEGRIAKLYAESVLLEQQLVMDPKVKISETVSNFAKETSSNTSLTSFVLFKLGEVLPA